MNDARPDDLGTAIEAVRHDGRDRDVRCPAHDDRHASLSVGHGDNGRVLLHCHAGCEPEAILQAAGRSWSDLAPPRNDSGNSHQPSKIIATYNYDKQGELLYQKVRKDPKAFLQRRPDGNGGWIYNLKGVPRVLYRESELAAADPRRWVLLAEGEKDADRLAALSFVATTNVEGAGKWRREYSEAVRGRRIAVLPDNDEAGRQHAETVARALTGVASEVRIVELPGLPEKGDVSDYLDAGHDRDELIAAIKAAQPYEPADDESDASPPPEPTDEAPRGAMSIADFRAYLPAHRFIFNPTRELWPAASVDARVPWPIGGNGKAMRPSRWLDKHRPVEQMTWAPGEPMLIDGWLIDTGGWIRSPDCTTFNLYRAPTIEYGNADDVGPWLDHVHRVYPDDAGHVIKWLAQRVQSPGQKINHALVLGGEQGIGKDSLIEPAKHAVGPWNCQEVSPSTLLGRFNGFAKSVILRVSEARDLGEMDRFAFYDHTKTYTAAPPDVIRCDEKNLREHAVPNVCGVIITTNHKTDGIFLPADDRRHYVAWSDAEKDDFTEAYWNKLWRWYRDGGISNVAAYLAGLDLSGFDPKAPPPKTAAFWHIVDASRAPEDAELRDVLELLGHPDALTIDDLIIYAPDNFAEWLRDRRHRRQVPHRLEAAGYEAIRNDATSDGRWKVMGKNLVVYARRDFTIRERIAAATALASNIGSGPRSPRSP